MYVASSACQLSCLAYHQEAGGKQHLSVAKIDWNFKKLCLATALYLFSITAYHLNFMGQILGWARIANFAEKERTNWIIFIFTARYFWINLFLIAILCFISYLQDCLCPQSEMTCNIHCHYCQGLLEAAIVDRKSYKKAYSTMKYEIKWSFRDELPFNSIKNDSLRNLA